MIKQTQTAKDRYKQIIIGAINIIQKKIEIEDYLQSIRENILVSELDDEYNIDQGAAYEALQDAIGELGACLKPCRHVKLSVEYKDVDISLHAEGLEAGRAAISRLMDEINE